MDENSNQHGKVFRWVTKHPTQFSKSRGPYDEEMKQL